MARTFAQNAKTSQENFCDNGNSAILRHPQNAGMDYGKWITDGLAKPGRSKSGLARALGIHPAGVTRMLKGGRQLKAEEIAKAQAYFDDAGQARLPGIAAPVAPNARAAPPELEQALRSRERDVPVMGKAAAGSNGDFSLNGEVVDYALRPPGVAGRRGIFVIYVDGSSMSPWREPGDPVYLDEVRAARPGDYVLVECHGDDGEPGAAYLKRLVSIGAGKVRLAQHNPPDDRIEVPAKKIKKIYRVIPWQELMGV